MIVEDGRADSGLEAVCADGGGGLEQVVGQLRGVDPTVGFDEDGQVRGGHDVDHHGGGVGRESLGRLMGDEVPRSQTIYPSLAHHTFLGVEEDQINA